MYPISPRFWIFICAVFCLLTAFGADDKRGCITVVGNNAVSLGTYPNADDGTARFQIRNSGDSALQITRVATTCKCMRVDGYPRSLGPGENGEVSVSIVRNEITGAFERVFYVENDDPQNRRIRFTVTGNAQPLFLVTCDAKTLLGQVDSGSVWTGRYTVAATATGLSLGTASVQSRGTRCEFSIRTNQAETVSYEVTQAVTFEGEGLLESALLFPVRRPGGAESPPVRLAVTAFHRKPLRVAPDRLNLSASKAVAAHRFLVSVDSVAPVDTGLLSCKAGGEGMTAKVTQTPSRKAFFVELTFSSKYFDWLAVAEKDTIRFSYGDRDHVEIPVVLVRQ